MYDSYSPEMIAKFWDRVTYEPNSGCWLWTAGVTKGYGHIWNGRRQIKAHRMSYEILIGPIPDGLFIDRLCRVPCCVNPSHLEPVTSEENWRRGMSPSAVAVRENLCIYGHSLNDAYISKGGGRSCRTCKKKIRRRIVNGKMIRWREE